MWILHYLYRRLTDRKVYCNICGVNMGYVYRHGHTSWACAACSETGYVTDI